MWLVQCPNVWLLQCLSRSCWLSRAWFLVQCQLTVWYCYEQCSGTSDRGWGCLERCQAKGCVGDQLLRSLRSSPEDSGTNLDEQEHELQSHVNNDLVQ